MKILFAEDQDDIREIISLRLTKKGGHTVKAVTDGDELLAVLESNEIFDAIVTDNHMVRVDGLEVLRRLRADSRLKSLPVIVHSSDATAQQEVVALGGVFVEKSTSFSDLLTALDKIATAVP